MTPGIPNGIGGLRIPDYLHAFDGGEWSYYVHSHDEQALSQIDEQDELQWEALWMRPVRASSLDESEIDDATDTVRRGPDGRFEPRWCWIECGEKHPDAEPFMGVKYAP